ncbi:MAG TPA: hypothetical protein DCO75_00810 [Fibrobacteres bacterium]|nr:hypothetical protein [Fibrobacterota bacterium]
MYKAKLFKSFPYPEKRIISIREMETNKMRTILNLFPMLLLFPSILFAHIDIYINSGNPAFPFPQFKDYENKSGTYKSLASVNPTGVTHAEMEKTIRDAYRIMMNRVYKTGTSYNGKDYLHYTSTPDFT